MYRKILISLICFFSFFNYISYSGISYAAEGWWQANINCAGLPWCKSGWEIALDKWTSSNIWLDFIVNVVNQFIQLIAVIAVFALIFSWVMYLVSMWEDEKVKKAKDWIIYSLIWVFLSLSAWWIINLLNNFKISM